MRAKTSRLRLMAGIAISSGLMAGPLNAGTLAIIGGTLIDVSHYGATANDIANATVIIKDGKIIAAGPAASVKVPKDAKRINAHGRFLTPGLIDGFGALRDQGFANAFLYEGVTSVYIIAPDGDDGRRGKLATGLTVSPFLLLSGWVTGYSPSGESVNDQPPAKDLPPGSGSLTAERLRQEPISRAQVIAHVREIAAQGRRGVWMDYDVWPYQVDAVMEAARPLQLATIGEFGFTSYPYGVRAGVGTFVHTQRYTSGLALPSQQLAYADAPGLPQARPALDYVCTASVSSDQFKDYAQSLAMSRTTLMPTAAMLFQAYGLPGLPSPWSRPSAAMISPSQLHLPLDRKTGLSERTAQTPPAVRKQRMDCAEHYLEMDKAFHAAGVHFLAASGTSAFGMMPGGGLRLELLVFVDKIGMTPREALAAATSNFADAYGWPDVGRIEPGRRGDILVLTEDPRASVKALDAIEALILAGEPIARAPLLRWRPAKP